MSTRKGRLKKMYLYNDQEGKLLTTDKKDEVLNNFLDSIFTGKLTLLIS